MPGLDLWGALSSEDTALDWGDEDLGVRYTLLRKAGDETDDSEDEEETLSPRCLGWEDDVEAPETSASEEDCGEHPSLTPCRPRARIPKTDVISLIHSYHGRGAARGTLARRGAVISDFTD